MAALVVMPTSLGTSTSAAVVGGGVDELASVRATVGKAEAGVDQENATEEREGWRRRKDWTPSPGSRGGVGGGGPSRRVALPVVIPNQVGLASLVVAVVPTVVEVWRRSLIRCGLHEGAGSGERGT